MPNYAKIKARAAAARARKERQEASAALAKAEFRRRIALHLDRPTPVASAGYAAMLEGAVTFARELSLTRPGEVIGVTTDSISGAWYEVGTGWAGEITVRDGVLLKMPRVTMFGQYAAADKTDA